MKFFSITAEFVGGPFTFGLRTPDNSDLDKKVVAVVNERYRTKKFSPGPISFKKQIITEIEFNNLSPAIKWCSNELEEYLMQIKPI